MGVETAYVVIWGLARTTVFKVKYDKEFFTSLETAIARHRWRDTGRIENRHIRSRCEIITRKKTNAHMEERFDLKFVEYVGDFESMLHPK